jgi:hypothetical protein
MDVVQSLADLAWPPPLLCAQTGLPELRDTAFVSGAAPGDQTIR